MSAFVTGEMTNKCYSTLLKTRAWIISGKFFKYKTCTYRLWVLAKLEPPYKTAFERRTILQVQETVLHKMCHTASHTAGLSEEVLGMTKRISSTFGRPNKVASLFPLNTLYPQYGGNENTTAKIKVIPHFFAWTFALCHANLPKHWHRHVGVYLNYAF